MFIVVMLNITIKLYINMLRGLMLTVDMLTVGLLIVVTIRDDISLKISNVN